MIRVCAPSRLHFGLLSLPPAGAVRRFGGVGLMVDDPGVVVTARPAAAWKASGPLAERALDFARRFAATVPGSAPAELIVERCAAEHAGLGTGTQLGLAVARALALLWDVGALAIDELARRIGRGRRSSLGVHGFAQGGFLVDGGQGARGGIAPLAARADWPPEWRVLLITRENTQGLHDGAEAAAFARLEERGFNPARTATLCRLVLLGMLPALGEHDLDAFGEALYDFNVRVGEAFVPFQGDVFANPRVAEVVAALRRQGVRGVGQSSWGPTVFAVVGDAAAAEALVRFLRRGELLHHAQVVMTTGRNQGASSETLPASGTGPTLTRRPTP